MMNNIQQIPELWSLLREQEQKQGLYQLSLIERDILENIALTIGKNKSLRLKSFLNLNDYPRTTFFRSLKKLREKNYIKIVKKDKDKRKSVIYLKKNKLRNLLL